MEKLNPNDAKAQKPLNLAFGTPATCKALLRLAEKTLGTSPRIPQFRDGLQVLLGEAGAQFVYHVLACFDGRRLNEFIEHFGLEADAERNLRAFVVRWAPLINEINNGERIRTWDMLVEIGPCGSSDYIFEFATTTDEFAFRLHRRQAIQMICSVLHLMDRAKELPGGVGPELIKQLEQEKTQ